VKSVTVKLTQLKKNDTFQWNVKEIPNFFSNMLTGTLNQQQT